MSNRQSSSCAGLLLILKYQPDAYHPQVLGCSDVRIVHGCSRRSSLNRHAVWFTACSQRPPAPENRAERHTTCFEPKLAFKQIFSTAQLPRVTPRPRGTKRRLRNRTSNGSASSSARSRSASSLTDPPDARTSSRTPYAVPMGRSDARNAH